MCRSPLVTLPGHHGTLGERIRRALVRMKRNAPRNAANASSAGREDAAHGSASPTLISNLSAASTGGFFQAPQRCARGGWAVATRSCPRPDDHGASRDRTGDLRVANATLSQLSYGPGRPSVPGPPSGATSVRLSTFAPSCVPCHHAGRRSRGDLMVDDGAPTASQEEATGDGARSTHPDQSPRAANRTAKAARAEVSNYEIVSHYFNAA